MVVPDGEGVAIRHSMSRASSAENWKKTSTSKAVTWRGRCADPKMRRATCASRALHKGPHDTPLQNAISKSLYQ